MEVNIACSGGGYVPFPFMVNVDTSVENALQAAADEWGAGFLCCKLFFAGEELPESSLLVSHGIEGGSQLEVWKGLGCKLEDMCDGSSKMEEILLTCDEDGFLPVDTLTLLNLRNGARKPSLTLCSLSLQNGDSLVHVGEYFVGILLHTKRLQFPSFCSMKSVGDSFLSGFTSLTSVDLSGLSKVESIGNHFLFHGKELQAVDLSPLVNLKYLGNNSLEACCELSSINMNLPLLERVPNGFLAGSLFSRAANLKSVDLSGLSSVTCFGSRFMEKQGGLKTIEFGTAMKNVQKIENNFLAFCSALDLIDFESFTSLQEIGEGFIRGCSSLKLILNISTLFENVRTIGNAFMMMCSSITELDLSMCSSVESVGNEFARDCKNLHSIDISGLTNITSIGDAFLMDCFVLKEIDFSNLSSLTSVGDSFLQGCHKLKTVNFDNLYLTKVGRNCLKQCFLLTEEPLMILTSNCDDDDGRLLRQRGIIKEQQTQAAQVVVFFGVLESKMATLSEKLTNLEKSPRLL